MGRGVVAQLREFLTKSGPPYRASTSPVPTSTEATAACRSEAFLSAASAACRVLRWAALTAAFCACLSKVVVILSPPPWIWDSSKPAATSSRSTILSRKPLGPPYRSLVSILGKAGSARP